MKMICDVPDEVIKCIKDGTWCGSSVAEKMIANGIPLSSSEKPKSEWQQDHEILKAYSDGANDVLDEIKADIEQTTSRYCLSIEHSALGHVVWSDRLIKESEVLEIIDKYKAEGSGEE